MSKIFTSFKIKNVELKNRLIRSATTSYWSNEEGVIRKPILQYYADLAKGGLGFIIKGHSYVLESGKAHTGQSGLTYEKHLPKMKELTKIVHSQNVPIIAQINHAGMVGKVDRITASQYKTENWEAREASIDDIQQIIEGFANAADFAIQAGFDGVQIHGAHGYLVSQFLSDRVNKREDKYGGSLEKRAKLLFEIFDAIKRKIGNAPIISIKMNCDDFLEGGITLEESKKIAKMLSNLGFDAIEISSCMWDTVKRKKEEIGWKPSFIPESRTAIGTINEPAYHLPYAKEIKKVIDSPLILVGGINSINLVEEILNNGDADFVSFSRPLIREPDLPNKWLKGIGSETCKCISCNACLGSVTTGSLRCLQRE